MKQRGKNPGSGRGQSRRFTGIRLLVVVAIVVAVVVAGWLWLDRRSSGEGDSAAPVAPATDGATQPQMTVVSQAMIDKITGRWLRPDGGYIIDIRGGDTGGSLQVEYFNPRPINVSRAVAAESPQGLQVFIELRDVGYPGATYTLVYDERRDVLEGLYYQPSVGQTFDVVFVREPERN
jgi:hypothetical protein